MKKFIGLFFSLTLVFSLFACGGAKESTPKEDAKKDENKTVVEKLVVGTEGTYPPFTFHDENDKLTGFDVEIAEEVAKRLGVEIEFKETQWDAMFAGLDAKRFDMIANQVGIKPERQEKYLFSNPYITSSAVLVTKKDNSEIKAFEDLKGKKTAQSLTSNYAEIAKKNGAEIVGVEGFNQAIELLKSGRVDATVNDKLSVLTYIKEKKDQDLLMIETTEDKSDSGLMFRKDSEALVKEVNKALDEMKSDGTYDEIYNKWFGENSAQ
jgi:cystine transport system substrate-binding protein